MSAATGIMHHTGRTQVPTKTNSHQPRQSSGSDIVNNVSDEEQSAQAVLELVRRYTSRSEHFASPFHAKDGRLDPRSEDFRAADWAKAYYNLRYSGEEAVPRVAGIAFRDLNVWGKGSPTDFQSTVGNSILKLPSILGKGTQKIEILRGFDGLVLPGEQLCVLGPPG